MSETAKVELLKKSAKKHLKKPADTEVDSVIMAKPDSAVRKFEPMIAVTQIETKELDFVAQPIMSGCGSCGSSADNGGGCGTSTGGGCASSSHTPTLDHHHGDGCDCGSSEISIEDSKAAKAGFDSELKARMMVHAPTAKMSNGVLELSEETLVKPNGRTSQVKTFKVATSAEDDVRSLNDQPELRKALFGDLQHMNVIVTNACNLSCTYCYEQHKKDYGKWDLNKLNKAYAFLKNNSQAAQKIFQFFGGEPLIHKKLIMDFVRHNAPELEKDAQEIQFGMVTNGLLLDKEFMEEYFTHKFATMTISLDTIDVTKDHRQLKQEDIDHILSMVELIPEYHRNEKQVVIRCTISQETAPDFPRFADVLASHGVNNIIVHPLTMSNYQGQMQWPEDMWNQLQRDMFDAGDRHPEMEIRFSEGVGVKGATNCLVGSGMIAMDASGDYAGCYFFTNIKEAAHPYILGNIFDEKVYLNRYRTFQKKYADMLERPECKACDLKGFCYQCPAGNLDTGSKEIFRPDGMCKKIVKMYLDVQDRLTKKQFIKKAKAIKEAILEENRLTVMNRSMFHLVCKTLTGYLPKHEVVQMIEANNAMPHYKVQAAAFSHLKDDYAFCGCAGTIDTDYKGAEIIHKMKGLAPIEVHQAYRDVLDAHGLPLDQAMGFKATDSETEIWLVAMMHLVVLNKTNHVEVRNSQVNHAIL
ncbi:radical SAM/SPASM domain-containing protein [Ewingella americana]|uniref:Radical SAM protein n=1 Tax=Ewingella americana TaxID=41202 RepID=A0A502GHB9_9GAMM|nr:radical SAM protein [Ewingella americana]TPG60123.1 radical SAM protein [Ewingella americana]